MLKVFDATSLEVTLDFAVATMLLKGGADATKLIVHFQNNGYSVDELVVVQRRGTIPAFFVLRSGNNVAVAIQGITTPVQAAALFASLSLPFYNASNWQVNSMVAQDASFISAQLGARFGGRGYALLVCGYSYGGALACDVAAIALANGNFAEVDLLTFGSPRPGPRSLADWLTRATVRRWMNDSDPIPHFPPHAVEAPAGTVAVGLLTAALISQYTQPQGGLVLDVNNDYTALDLPPLFVPIADADLVGWATGANGVAAAGHSIQLYCNRLGANVHKAPLISPASPPGSTPEQAAVMNNAAFSKLVAEVATDALFASRIGGQSAMYIPPLYRPKVLLLNGRYQVFWMGTALGAFTTKSAAKTCAKYLFKHLRTLQPAPQISITNYAACWAAFWTVAVSAANGFDPPFNAS